MGEKTLVLIDGHAVAYRYFFALERTGMKTSSNQPTWAVFGFFKALFDMLKNKDIHPDSIAVAFDVGRQTYRVEMYPEYKANRETMPDTLHSQLGLIIEGLKAFNIPIFTKEGYEADDVIGTIVTKAKQLRHKSIILTGDKDSFQLIDRDGFISVLMPSKGELVMYDWYKVHDKMGVYPYQIIDFKGLSGDTSDNIPGIRGVGDKTASKLLSQFDKLEEVYAHIEDVSGKALKQKLKDNEDIAKLSKELATIQKNIDIDFDFETTKLENPNVEEVIEFFKKNQLYSFLKNIDEIMKPFKIDIPKQENTEKETTQTSLIVPSQGQLQLGLGIVSQLNTISEKDYKIEKIVIDTEGKLDDLIKKLNTQTLFSIDTETTSLDPLESDLVGISIAYNEQITAKNNRVKIIDTNENKTYSYYIPLFHQVGEQLNLEYVKEKLSPVLSDEKISKSLQNAKFDYNVLRRNGMNLNGIIIDTMLASYIKDSSRKHGLKVQASEHLDYIMTDYEELTGKGKNAITMETVPIEDAANYSCDDAFATLELSRFWQKNLDDKELDILYDIEVPLTLVLAEMEWNGVSIDKDYLKELDVEINKSLQEVEAKIYEEAKEEFNINSPKQVGEILFEKLKLKGKGKNKTKTGYSTSAKVLEELAEYNQIAKDILEQRHLSKLKTTYIETLPQLISPIDQRLHTSFNQTITSTGRLSSSNPNLQNIPIRTALGNRIRGAFVPKDKENAVILSADYSQVELRLLAHCAKDDNLIEAFCEDEDIHTITAAKVFEVPIEGVTKEMRRKAKAVNFGIVYGQSRYGLASSLGISSIEAQIFIDKYFATYPQVKEYMENTIKFAYEHGYVETIYGRKRHLAAELTSATSKIQEAAQRAAINAPIQGTAADVVKIAMNKLQKSLFDNNLKSKIILQVHDELVLEVLNTELDEVKKLVVKSMELGQPFLIPLKVDIAVGKSWMEN
ncbi:MAG: DNA polymerase I [Candidatus Gastranaerophilales bacterium]|nr:DNA polymerase I [Candidatus Gastranaerophilales bacterium]